MSNYLGDDGKTTVEYDPRITELEHIIRENRSKLPDQKTPTILICGKLGSGKSTTINTLFGDEVSRIGHFSRGTTEEKLHVWEAKTENINIVDLPGLGDSPANDREFRKIYKANVANADGFIVVVNPPRPAEDSTLKTVRLLLASGVASRHMIFAFNKLSSLMYPGDQGLTQVQLDGLIGPVTEDHTRAIRIAKEAFLQDLRSACPSVQFEDRQVIAFDSLSGWNLHNVLLAVVELLPYQALARLRWVAREAHRKAVSREEERLKAEQAKLEEKKRELEDVEKKLRDTAKRFEDRGSSPSSTFVKIDLRNLQGDINDKKREIENSDKHITQVKTAIHEYNADMVRTERTMVERISDGVAKVVEGIKEVKKEVVDGVRNAGKKMLKWIGWER